MLSFFAAPDLSDEVPEKDLIRIKGESAVHRHIADIKLACCSDYRRPGTKKRRRRKKSKFAHTLIDYEERLAKWDRMQAKREQKYESFVPPIVFNELMDMVLLYHKGERIREAFLRKRTEAMLARAECECWEYEFDRLALLVHRLYMETERAGLNLSDSLKIAISRFYEYRLRCLTTQEKRVQTLKKNKANAKKSDRKRIMGLIIDALLMATDKQDKSGWSTPKTEESGSKVRLKQAITRAMQRWAEYPPNQKKLKGNTRQVRLQNMRRRYFPEGIRKEPVIMHVVHMIEEGASAGLKKYKSDLGGKDFQNCAVSVAKAEILYEKIEQHYRLFMT